MSATLMDGKQISQAWLNSIKEQCDHRQKQEKKVPCLAVILVGDNPASAVYVKNKELACQKVGFRSLTYRKEAQLSETALLALVAQLNSDPEVHGILVQLPLPSHIDENKVIEAIHPQKDVDGFHPYNMGRLILKRPCLRPCTPKGIVTLLEAYKIEVEGMKAVVVGQSNIVGRPAALELLRKKATVTICHRATRNLNEEVKQADLLIVAVGQPNLIQGEWIKPGAVVIDVGINRLDNGTLCGDVDFNAARLKASYITPVPGGIGPMTIAALLDNTLIAAEIND
ncbi:MAG: bifunctional methylenetetrahydrofolate dehydrogenase/methenyltetrahydrofolate cyclohydrolase FolD [Neisseriaceae bacterium]